jgi:RNA recognition motif-containing protein
LSGKVFVGNLDFQTSVEEVRALFAEIGEVADVSMPTDRMTGRPRGFAFVEYADTEHAEEATRRLNGHELAGRPLRVNRAEERPSGGGPGGFSRPDRPPGQRPSRPKGSRRNVRARKRSIW